MSNAIFKVPPPQNEPILSYEPGSIERKAVKSALAQAMNQKVELPMFINGRKVFTNRQIEMHPPHLIRHQLGTYSHGDQSHVKSAIDAALNVKRDWENLPWQDRAAIFLKAADLIAVKYRAEMNAATMIAQSKNVFQAEIDCVAEMADFLRFNVAFMTEIYHQQPLSAPLTWNRLQYRPLEGFVFALTPFNFTSIAGNLPSAPALFGNTVVWKPAESQIYSAHKIMEIFTEAGLPDGVINLVYVDGPQAGEVIFQHPEFAGLHFTGSTQVFQLLWKTIGNNIHRYNSYPRIVGETGGKDFVMAHPSADPMAVSTALSRGAFEFQGQKCSAASRAYIPKSLWPIVKESLLDDISSFKIGSPDNFSNFINAVIDGKAFDKIAGYIDIAHESEHVQTLIGGKYDNSEGFYIHPTVLQVEDPKYRMMCEEIFGPVLSIFVYEDQQYEATLKILDETSPYALTGSIFAQDRNIIQQASEALKYAAGNFYINDKPTGAVVGQQPFGGARGSGTNDKAGSILNLYRWISPRTIKENFNPPHDYRYPFMKEE